ncbi:CLUMA_CG021194, isoform A [Clunio marinus]|uniref:CLUMA_CG021194, isoform A n=1 Tax=Clunio marinus TaxID=568069 RepID=A0A1J1JAZ2_9DIPT|nr:CLUMA_CG021194, isoform A [Clunio marinus]
MSFEEISTIQNDLILFYEKDTTTYLVSPIAWKCNNRFQVTLESERNPGKTHMLFQRQSMQCLNFA